MKSRSGTIRPVVLSQIFVALCLFSLNHWSAMARNSGDYTPFSLGHDVSPQVFDESHLYASAAQRFLRSGRLASETDGYERRDLSIPYPMFPSLLVGVIARISGGLELAWIITQAVFPTILWITIFWWMGTFSTSISFRSLAAWTTVLIPFGPRSTLLMAANSYVQPLEVMRCFQPCISFPLFIFALVASLKAAHRGGGLRYLCAGLLSSLLFYSYYFYWVPLFSILFILMGIALVHGEKEVAKRFAWVAGVGIGLGSPFLWIAHAAKSQITALLLRQGFFSRSPSVTGFLLIAAGILPLVWYWRKQRGEHSFGHFSISALLASIAAAGVGLNLQLVTGYDANHGCHVYNRLLQPMLVLISFAGLGQFLIGPRREIYGKCFRNLAVVMTVMLVTVAAYRQYRVGKTTAHDHRASASRVQALKWLHANASGDAVTGTVDREMIALMPVIAGTWSFVPSNYRTGMSDTEIWTRFLVLSAAQGISLEEIGKLLAIGGDNSPEVPARLWHSLGYILVSSLRASADQLKPLWHTLDVQKELTTRKLDYLVVSKGREKALSTSLPSFRTAYSNEDWVILKREF